MAKQVRIRRGTADQHTTFVGALGEVTMDTTNKTLCVHDGVTPGGVALAKQGEGMPANADYVISSQTPTAANNYTWYRKYKSGWVEQGGIWTGNLHCDSGGEITPGISLPIAMQDTKYYASASTIEIYLFPIGQHRTKNFVTFRMGAYTVARTLTSFAWYVSGIAE